MLKQKLSFTTSVLVVLSMLAVAVPAFALTGTHHAKGAVTAINRKTHVMTIKTSTGARVKLKYNRRVTRLYHNGTRLGLSHLHVGNQVNASFTPKTSTNVQGTANDVEDDNGISEIEGTVAAVDTTANTVTITPDEGGSNVVLNVDSSTVITRDGAAAALGDLKFGDKVQAEYDSATMLASKIEAESSTEESEVEGTISSVDTSANTITITPEDGSSGGEDVQSATSSDITLNVDSSTVIMLDDNPASLGDLQSGFKVEAKYDPSSMLASFIEAEHE